ncbi:MAG TPA: phosphatase PAP2 family protein [Ktedonobacterales bacterium]|nr:phosphatase PAP2 family protein [Ktedonobacterales bacterium]
MTSPSLHARDELHQPDRSLAPSGHPARSSPARERERWTPRRVALAVLLWVLGAVALVVLSVFAHRYAAFPGDVGLTEWVQQLHQPIVVRFINISSDLNWPLPAGIIAIVVILVLAILRQIRAAICAAIAGFGADALNVTLNGAVARPRPNNVHIHAVAHLGLHSYPSGHVTHVIAFYGFLFFLTLLAGREHPAWRPWLFAVRAICLYFIVFIGPSRLLEGEHWPSDVLASYLLGALILAVSIAIYHLLGYAWDRYRASHPRPARRVRGAEAR